MIQRSARIPLLALLFMLGFILTGCSGKWGQATDASNPVPTMPQTEIQTSSPTTLASASPVHSPNEPVDSAVVNYIDLLENLDKDDVNSGAKAVQMLKEIYATGEIIRDEDMTALIKFIASMWPERYSMFPDSVKYPRSGLECTDWTLDGMRIFYENYLYADEGEGMLYFQPDYVKLGMEFYDMVSPAYQDFFEMQFDIAFFKLQSLFEDNHLAVSQGQLRLALDIYTTFTDAHPSLADEHEIPRMISTISDFVLDIK